MSEKATRPCPFCSVQIKSIAIRCRHCGSMIVDPPSMNSEQGSASFGGWERSSPDVAKSVEKVHQATAKSVSSDIMLVKNAFSHRYDIQYEVGRGGMATVYKAVEKSSKRVVALKVVHKNLSHDTEFLARFHREAQLCAKLDHRTDLYSLGVVMYECLTGKVPFKGENMISTIFKVLNSEPDQKPLNNFATSIKNLVITLLKKDAESRPGDALSVAKTIRGMLQGQVSYGNVENEISGSNDKHTVRNSRWSNQKHMTSGIRNKPGSARRELSPLIATLLIIMLVLIIIIITQLISML